MIKYIDVIIPVVFVVLIITILVLTFVAGLIGADQKEKKKRLEILAEELTAAIAKSSPTWDELVDMATISGHTAQDVYQCLRSMNKLILIGKADDIAGFKDLIQSYMAKHKLAEPFEGLPTETRLHLERLRSAMDDNAHLLEPLTIQIRELVSVYEREKKRQQRYTAWGFFLAVASFAFAAWSYFNPYVASR